MKDIIAQKSVRLVNCMIDVLAILVINCVIELIFDTYAGNSSEITISVFILYYLLLEGIFGQTIGKYVTGCRVRYLKKNNRWFWLILRTFLRLNPLNQLSFLFGQDYGTHDQVSLTRVVMIDE